MVLTDLATVRFRIYDDPECTIIRSNTTYCSLLNFCQPIYLSWSEEASGEKSGIYGVYNYEHYSTVHDDNTYGVDDKLDSYVFILNTYSDPKCTYTIQGSQQLSELSLNCFENSCCPFQFIYGANGMVMKYAKIHMDTHASTEYICPPNSTAYIDQYTDTRIGNISYHVDMYILSIGILLGCMLTLVIQTWCKDSVKLPDDCGDICKDSGIGLIEYLNASQDTNADENTNLTYRSDDSTGYIDYLSSFVLPSRDNSS